MQCRTTVTLHVLLGLILAAWAMPSSARTWTVAKDGSGEFSVIQDAVDASFEMNPTGNDTVLIGPGRYFDAQSLNGSGVVDSVAILVQQTNLTLVGAGADETIVAQQDYDEDSNAIVAATHFGSGGVLRVEGIGFAKWDIGVRAEDMQESHVTGCEFEEYETGIFAVVDGSLFVSGCSFETDLPGRAVLSHSLDYASITGCRIANGHPYGDGVSVASTADADMSNCEIDGGFGGVNVTSGSRAEIENCTFTGQETYGAYAVRCSQAYLYLSSSLIEDVYLGIIVRNNTGTGECVVRGVTVSDVQAGSFSLILLESPVSVQDCELAPGAEFAVRCYGGGSADVQHADFANIWWGTADETVIQSLIWDHNDDPDLGVIIDYIPYVGMVAIESRSWTQLRSLFR